MSTGAIPTRRRCCWCTAGATIAATGTGWPQALRNDWHIICPDLRGHGDSQWSPDGNYSMSAYIYDLAQLVHQQALAPVTIVAHSLGGNICLRYAGIYPDKVRRLVAIEGLGPSPKVIAERSDKTMDERMREWIDEQRKLSRPPAAPLSHHRGRLQAHAGGEQASLGRAGPASDAAGREPERGRHLQLEVRQLRARLAALRHGLRGDRAAVVAHRLPDPADLRQGKLGLQPREGRPPEALQDRQGCRVRQCRPLGPPRPAAGLRRRRPGSSSNESGDLPRRRHRRRCPARARAGARPGAGQDAGLRHLRLGPARRQARATAWSR